MNSCIAAAATAASPPNTAAAVSLNDRKPIAVPFLLMFSMYLAPLFLWCAWFRYKNAMQERYRDVASKCDRYLPPPHYLATGGTSLVSNGGGGGMANNVVDTNAAVAAAAAAAANMYGSMVNRSLVANGNNSIVTNSTDNYLSGYLSSTVHTPVKRYIPSTNTIATDIYSDSTVVLPHHQQVIRKKIWKLHYYYCYF